MTVLWKHGLFMSLEKNEYNPILFLCIAEQIWMPWILNWLSARVLSINAYWENLICQYCHNKSCAIVYYQEMWRLSAPYKFLAFILKQYYEREKTDTIVLMILVIWNQNNSSVKEYNEMQLSNIKWIGMRTN